MISFSVNQQAGKKIPSKIWQKWLKKISNNVKIKKEAEIGIAVVGDQEIRKLNKIYRRRDKVTNVLSFRDQDSSEKIKLGSSSYLGEIVICYPQAVRESKKMSIGLEKHLEFLFIHGFLHLLGYDHGKESEAAKMERLEDKIIKT